MKGIVVLKSFNPVKQHRLRLKIEKCSINSDKNKHCSLKGDYFHRRVVFSLFSAGLFLVYCLLHSLI